MHPCGVKFLAITKALVMIQKVLFCLIVCWSWSALASSTTSKQLDAISNSTGGSSLSVPSTGTAFSTDTNTLTLQNKTISGASNTLSQLPVASQIFQDLFIGNGVSTSFSLSHTQVGTSGLLCYLDGMLLTLGASYDYTFSGTTLTLAVAPATGQKVICAYSQY